MPSSRSLRSLRTRPPVLFASIVLLSLLQPASANRIQDLRNCVGGLNVWTPDTADFQRLKLLSFRNDFVTPLAIAEAANEQQVATLIKCAREVSIRVCARSGGHSLIGHNLCKGLVIDLNKMRDVSMQPGGVARIEPGAVIGEVLWIIHKSGRWLAAGVCPNVGFAGYVLGDGHGPYEGRLGLACDSMLSLRMVDRFGKAFTVSKSSHSSLFWAMCGAGGGQFGIVTEFRWKTVSSAPFDRAVIFRFLWPRERGGELLEKWQDYDEHGGDVWFRIEMIMAKAEEGVAGYGACYNVNGVRDCLSRLGQAAFFNVPGRVTKHISFTGNAIGVHAFFGPEGGYGKFPASNLFSAMNNWRAREGGAANGRSYKSTFLKKGKKKPSRKFWQDFVDFCQNPNRESIPWSVCEMNLFNNAIDQRQPNAFAFRSANIITHYIIGGGSNSDRNFAYSRMQQILRKFVIGVYVNYPELELKKKYAKAYWGKSLKRLRTLKKKHDPKNFFMNPQPIP